MQRTLLRRVLQVTAGVMLLWLGVFFGLNDQRVARLVTKVVSANIRGQFILGHAHYDYFSSLASLIFNTPAHVRGGDFEMLDPDGNLVMKVKEVEADMYIGELVRSLIHTAFSAPLHRGVFIDLHFNRGTVHGGFVRIQATASSLQNTPDHPEINIVLAMAGKKPPPETPQPGRLRIIVDEEGASFSDIVYEMNMPAWQARAEGLSGNATMRFSNAAGETRPGRPSFVYEVAPLSATGGQLVVNLKDGPPLTFPLRDIDMRRFGARASQRNNLSFRGKAVFSGAQVELSGALLDTYCDPGVELTLSFEQASQALAQLLPGLLIDQGQPRGQGRIRGPFSESLPVGPTGATAPCLAERMSPYPSGPSGRALVIEGGAEKVEADIAQIHVTDAQSQFRLVRGVLTLPSVTATALSGQVRAEQMRINLAQPIQVTAQIRLQGADPAEVAFLPREMRELFRGKLSGRMRFAGIFDTKRKSQRLRLSNIEAALSRQRRNDALPRELSLRGDVSYGPDQLSLRDIALSGEDLALSLPRGTVNPKNGNLDLSHIEVTGGQRTSRLLQALGIPATVHDAAASLNVVGKLRRPEVEQGALQVHSLDLSGRHIDSVVSGFTLHDGVLLLQGLKAQGFSGTASANGQLRLFSGDVQHRFADPPMVLNAEVAGLSTSQLLQNALLSGALSGQVELSGTLLRPVGSASLRMPAMSVREAQVHDLTVDLDLQRDLVLVNSLYALLGQRGVLSGNAQIGRTGDLPLQVTLTPDHLQIRDIPFIGQIPYQVAGEISGGLRIEGTARPLRPVLSGQLSFEKLQLLGRPIVRDTEVEKVPPRTEGPEDLKEAEPLLKLLGLVVRSLTLHRADLTFRPEREGTHVSGDLFNAFHVEGLVYLDPADFRGDLTLAFGQPLPLQLEQVVPELADLGIKVRGAGELRLQFGRGGLLATLRLFRADTVVVALRDDGGEQRYRMWNHGDVVVTTDGRNLSVQQAHFYTGPIPNGEADFLAAYPVAPPGQQGGRTYGEISASGAIGAERSDLHVLGQVRLELLEHLLRSWFKQLSGDVALDLHMTGPRDRLALHGGIDIGGVRLTPYDIETAFELPEGHLVLEANRATLRLLKLSGDGTSAQAQGRIEVGSYLPLSLGRISLLAAGSVSGRLLQFFLPRVLSEASGRIALQDVKIEGTVDAPQASGMLLFDRLFLNLRRFHEVLVNRGSVRLLSASPGTPARIVFGCASDQEAQQEKCQPIQATVDADSKARLSGTVTHTGLLGFLRTPWSDPLSRVDLGIQLENVRHSVSGVYNVEITAPALRLTGDRERLSLFGDVDVVSGRYIQPFDLKERFLARRVVEEEEPFWRGDPLLSNLDLHLNVITRGTFQVSNNIFELRLSTTDFSLLGPLSGLQMGGTIRVDGGTFNVPALSRGDFTVKGDSKIVFSPLKNWPDSAWVDVRGANVQFDPNQQQRNIELLLTGPLSALKIECLSSDGLNATDCASYLLLGGTSDQVRRVLAGDPSNASPRALAYSDNAAKLLSRQLLTQQLEDPLRRKLGLDTVRIQFGVSSFDVQLCKRFGLYMQACGLAEWGLLGATSARYRAYGEVHFSDWTVGQLSFDRLERGFEELEDTVNRFKLQLGARLPLFF